MHGGDDAMSPLTSASTMSAFGRTRQLEDATFVETLALATIAVALIAVEVAAVSLSYRELTANVNG